MPPRPVLVALLALAILPPFVARLSGSVVGSFTMFNNIERYHLDVEVVTDAGVRAVELRSLGPHLTPEAQRILLPAAGYAVGADQIDVVVESLPDLTALLCALEPNARSARARLQRDPFDARQSRERHSERRCRSQ